MKTIGLLGGMTWYSSHGYYRLVNEEIQKRLGGVHSAQCLLYSVDFGPMDALERQDRWDEAGDMVVAGAQHLEQGGAEFIVICSNTTHKSADRVQQTIGIPLLHIADATGRALCAAGMKRIGLLGTRFTMEEDYIRGKLERDYGLDIVTPDAEDREIVNRVIYDEFGAGLFLDSSRHQYAAIMARLADAGAQCILLGCTEIGLLVRPEDSRLPLFDTTLIHARAAVDYALGD